MLSYILYRLHECFLRKEPDFVFVNITIFAICCELSLFLFVYFVGGLFIDFDWLDKFLKSYREDRFSLIVPVMLILFCANYFFLKRKEYLGYFEKLKEQYGGKKHKIPMWSIFIIPIVITLVGVLLPGLIEGTARFPLFERLFM